MIRLSKTSVLFSVLGVSALVAAGCAGLIGLEERQNVGAGGQGGGGNAASSSCISYCDTVQESCTGTFQVYTTLQTCLDVCAALPPGDPNEPGGNTVACRERQAELAATTKEPAVHCKQAGPGGDGVCGENCDAWCLLLEDACPDDYGALNDCQSSCTTLPDTGQFDIDTNYSGDTLQCRLVHVSASMSDDIHCEHARFQPLSFCLGDGQTGPGGPADCDIYCRDAMGACTGDSAIYESTAQCLAVCKEIEDEAPGEPGDESNNTVTCRMYHAGAALASPVPHCDHTGPTGDGVCGKDDAAAGTTGNCESYCWLYEAACSSEFDSEFSSDDECTKACATEFAGRGAEVGSGYSVKTADDSDSLQCRVLKLAQVLETEEEAGCQAAKLSGTCN